MYFGVGKCEPCDAFTCDEIVAGVLTCRGCGVELRELGA